MFFHPFGGANTRIDVKGWNSESEVATHVVTTTKHGGFAARKAGTTDARGTMTLVFDLDNPHYASPNLIVEGTLGVVREALSANLDKFATIPVIIKKIRAESSVDSMLMITVDWEFNILAGGYSNPTG